MSIKRILVLTLLLFSIGLLAPKTAQAFDLRDAFTSENSVITKIQEGIEYFFAFKIENKILVLEKQAEKRLALAQSYLDKGIDQQLQSTMRSYLQIKDKQNDLLGKTNDDKIMNKVEERTVEQQKTMEEIKTKINEVGKQNVVKIQEQVVNQVAERVVATNGAEGATEFLNKVEHVWAPGTGPGGEAGVVYEGGGKLIFAPGTSAGSGNATSDIKTVEIKTGGTVNDPVPVQDGPNWAPGTSQGGSGGNTIDPGGVDQGDPGKEGPVGPGTSSNGETWIAP